MTAFHKPHINRAEGLPFGEKRRREVPPDPTEPVWMVDTHGVQHGPYARCFAKGLRRCFTTAGDFRYAELVPTGEPGIRATRVHGTWVKTP
jgi:hypothetical protein